MLLRGTDSRTRIGALPKRRLALKGGSVRECEISEHQSNVCFSKEYNSNIGKIMFLLFLYLLRGLSCCSSNWREKVTIVQFKETEIGCSNPKHRKSLNVLHFLKEHVH